MSIVKNLFKLLKASKPCGTVETPTITPKKVNPGLNYMVKCELYRISKAIHELKVVDELFRSPKVEYAKGVHTKAVMAPIKDLGVITIIFNTETGKPIFAELKEIEND